MRQRGTASREPLMKIVSAYLASHPCVDCTEGDPIVLDFDHRGDKSANVSDLVASAAPSALLRAEMAKCDIRCANCHRRKTVREVGGYRLRALSSATPDGHDPSTSSFVGKRSIQLSYGVRDRTDST
jgi:hypothetical protein